MSINVDPDLGAIVGLLEYKMKQHGMTQAAVQRELDWKGSVISQLLNRTKPLRVDQLLQILAVLDVAPDDFFLEAYGRPLTTNRDFEDELRLELVRLLHENLEVFGDRPALPQRDREPLADHLQLDLEMLDEPIAGARDLIAAARWMMTRLAPAERQMLVGLCERMGSFEAGIAVAEDLLTITGTAVEAVWAMEHQSLLVFDEDVDDDINLKAVLFLIDLEIKAGRRQDLAPFVKVRERLMAIQEESTAEDR